jgi:hypothetical protein
VPYPTFQQLWDSFDWKPIRNCPGRYVLKRADLSPEQLFLSGAVWREFRVAAAADPVLVAELPDGGLISYKRQDGSHIHTLNTPEGFRRKVAQLGLPIGSLSAAEKPAGCRSLFYRNCH